MKSETWKTLHKRGRSNRPGLNEIRAFLPAPVFAYFEEFSRYMKKEYRLGCTPPVYTEADGWVYKFGRSGVILLNRVSIGDGAFYVQDIRVGEEKGFQEALRLADRLYADGFLERMRREAAAKIEKQKLTIKRRLEREKAEVEKLSELIKKDRFNIYRWSPKLSRRNLKKLYESDAKGFMDEELLDEIGMTLYARCLQGRDERLLMESRKLKCHNCGAVLGYSASLMECSCGSQYLFREYTRAFRKNNMPSGSATHIFNAFIADWPRARGYAAKMRLVDGLVHEFHINLNSGVKGRFVGINLIEGTKKQIGDLILELAYDGSIN